MAGGVQSAVLLFDLVVDELSERVEVVSSKMIGKAGKLPGTVVLGEDSIMGSALVWFRPTDQIDLNRLSVLAL